MSKPDLPIEALIQQIRGADREARYEAARRLGQARDPRAVDALLPALQDPDWRVRRNAAQALGALRDRRAVGPLLVALSDRTRTVRQRAIVALGRIKDPQSVPALLEILTHNQPESDHAARAIRKFGKQALPQVARAFEQTNDPQLMRLLIEMKYEGAFDLIISLLQSDEPASRLAAIRELGQLRDQRAVPYLIELLQHTEPLIESEAVRALAKLQVPHLVPALLCLLTDHELFGQRSDVYRAVTEALQDFGGISEEIENAFPWNYPPAFNMGRAQMDLPEAIGFIRNDPSRMLVDALTRLQTGFLDPQEPIGTVFSSVRETLERLAWRFGVLFQDARDARQERVSCLIELLDSEASLKRVAAALSLPWYAEERALEPLKERLHDLDENVRAAAGWASRALQRALVYRSQSGS